MRLSERRHQLATGVWQEGKAQKSHHRRRHQQHASPGNIIFAVQSRARGRQSGAKTRSRNIAENIFNAPEVIIFSYFTPAAVAAAAASLHVSLKWQMLMILETCLNFAIHTRSRRKKKT